MLSWAVTMVVMVLLPTARLIGFEALPDAMATPFTVTVALGEATVGVTVRLLTTFGTAAV